MCDDVNLVNEECLEKLKNRGQWINENSAILVFHGIGQQKPLDTLDSFVRGLLQTYVDAGFDKSFFQITHKFKSYINPDGTTGYKNFIRITSSRGSCFYLDCYEFYWAPETENKVSWSDSQQWILSVLFNINKKEQIVNTKKQGEENHDKSLFFPNGTFSIVRYKIFSLLSLMLLPILYLISLIPVLGKMITVNYLGDIIAYNSSDPRSALFKIRRKIQISAYKEIRQLIESKEKGLYMYDNIIIVAHSLGT